MYIKGLVSWSQILKKGKFKEKNNPYTLLYKTMRLNIIFVCISFLHFLTKEKKRGVNRNF